MIISPTLIQGLEVVLLIVTILAVGRIFFLIGDVQKTLANVESTRSEIDTTLKRIETVADATEELMRTEIAPTLKVARETLVNVEVTTRALAESTVVVRKLAGSIENAQKFFSVSGPIAQTVLKRVGSSATGLLAGLASKLTGKGQPKAKADIAVLEEDTIVIPGTSTTNPVLKADAAKVGTNKVPRSKK